MFKDTKDSGNSEKVEKIMGIVNKHLPLLRNREEHLSFLALSLMALELSVKTTKRDFKYILKEVLEETDDLKFIEKLRDEFLKASYSRLLCLGSSLHIWSIWLKNAKGLREIVSILNSEDCDHSFYLSIRKKLLNLLMNS